MDNGMVEIYIFVNFFASDNFLIGFHELASGLRELQELELSDNKFNDSILSSLGGFSTLKSLHLSINKFTGSIGLNGKSFLPRMTFLREA